jgi:hypothetical protein
MCADARACASLSPATARAEASVSCAVAATVREAWPTLPISSRSVSDIALNASASSAVSRTPPVRATRA